MAKSSAKNPPKRPTRDEFELEELGNQLVEAKNENSEVVLTVWAADSVTGRIVAMDSRTRMIHVAYGEELRKVPFLDIMRVDYAGHD